MNLEAKDIRVRKSIVVNAPQAHVFAFFSEQHNVWWPREHHIGARESFTAMFEPRVWRPLVRAGRRWE